jgi:hypothetical protein
MRKFLMATAVSLLIVGGVFFVSNTTQPPRAVSELGNYILVDHALSRAERGLLGIIQAEGAPNPEIFEGKIEPGSGH